MTSIMTSGDIAYISFVLPDWMRVGPILITLVLYITSIEFFTDLSLMAKFGVLIMPIAAIYQFTYKTSTVIYKNNGIALHTLSIFGYKITNELKLSELHLSSSLKSSRYLRYPVLRLVTANKKKYVIGSFINQDINSFVEELQRFYHLEYEKNF